MKTSRPLLACGLATLMAVAACNKEQRPAASTISNVKTSALSPSTPVATINGQTITLGELDDSQSEKLYEMRKQWLENLVIERLIKAEAQKKGQTEEQYLKAEIDDKVSPPSEDEIKKVYDENVSKMPPGTKYEDVKPRIVEYLTQPKKSERARALFDELKKENKVAMTLPAPVPQRKEVEAKGPSRGPADAKVTIVEFSDFQCPFCGRAHDTVEQMMQTYAGKVRLVFRQFPLDIHPNAPKAAEAALCANEQGKFWEYHDILFKHQDKLDVPNLKESAKSLGLDEKKFDECLDSGKEAAVVKEDQAAGAKAGVNGTPAFFINGLMLSGAQPLDKFKELIDSELAAK